MKTSTDSNLCHPPGLSGSLKRHCWTTSGSGFRQCNLTLYSRRQPLSIILPKRLLQLCIRPPHLHPLLVHSPWTSIMSDRQAEILIKVSVSTVENQGTLPKSVGNPISRGFELQDLIIHQDSSLTTSKPLSK